MSMAQLQSARIVSKNSLGHGIESSHVLASYHSILSIMRSQTNVHYLKICITVQLLIKQAENAKYG